MIILNFSGACITNSKGQILLQKRSAEMESWGLPGGAVEVGESIEETVIREVKEETGLAVKVDNLIGVYPKYFSTCSNGDKLQSINYLFKCTALNGELTIDNKETFDLKYFDLDNIPELFNQQHKDMISDFIQNKSGVFR